MNTRTRNLQPSNSLLVCFAALALAGCASTGEQSATGAGSVSKSAVAQSSKYKTDDGRTIDIGKATSSNGGRSFKDPHLEKCWIADGFDFNGYDTLYIAPTRSTAKCQPDEEAPHQLAKENLPIELGRMIDLKRSSRTS
jgi:hypothetical protein